MDNFKIYISSNQGSTWDVIKDDIEGIFPVILPTYTGRILCAYIFENTSTKKNDLAIIYTDNDGTAWSDTITIRQDIIQGELGLEQSYTGTIYLTYWKKYNNVDTEYICWSYDNGLTWDVSNEKVIT